MWDRAILAGALLALWGVGSLWAGPEFVSSPWLVLQQLGVWVSNGVLISNIGYTILEATLGFVIGAVPGLLLPLLLRKRPFLAAVLDPFIIIGYGLPKVALIPLFIVWFGIGIWSKVALVASVSFFLVLFSTAEGVRAVEPRLIRTARVVGASEYQILRTIVMPSAIPFIMQAVQIALPLSIGGAAIAELVSSNRGLGFLIQFSAGNFEITGALAAVVALTAIVVATNLLVSAVERRLLMHRPQNNAHAMGAH
jgi:NitT/TauT family transport system permease protein